MRLIYRQHAVKRMFERGISTADVAAALADGWVIEEYPTDTPYPSRLWLGYSDGRPLHIVFADNQDDGERIIITVYRPDPALWADDFATRRAS
ncbi:DUF4258 domain-containing protein [Thauera aromatica]|uniref:DUF4258 domain-containing protein n=1 Tax=Thauera aromatica TaxID=59405 RepID=UPI001FFD2BAB|nr:DUF4258 domain-containing protein [Thauera aromatica]MCK2089818.1 DUF4258 domain-containing protein [Thauera aromatica]